MACVLHISSKTFLEENVLKYPKTTIFETYSIINKFCFPRIKKRKQSFLVYWILIFLGPYSVHVYRQLLVLIINDSQQ